MEKFYINKDDALLFVIDIQEKLAPAIFEKERVIKNSKIMISGANAFKLPIVVTEQYPKGLGPTIEELDNIMEGAKKFSKVSFSACTEEAVDYLEKCNKKHIIIIGMETHICVFQTVRDLLKLGYTVFVAEDAIGSRTHENYRNGIELMRDMGAIISNTETLLYDMLVDLKVPEFKTISNLVK